MELEPVLMMLTKTPWPWIIVSLLLLLIFFRGPISRMIDRMQKAKVKAGVDGAEIEFEGDSDVLTIDQATSSSELNKTDPQIVKSIKMKDVLLDHASEIDEIEGDVDIENLTMDHNSRIGRIKGS